MSRRFDEFAALHRPGNPVILYNVWDRGSALAVAGAGAKAIATGSHPVGDSSGFGDGEKVPLDFVFDNARRIVAAVDLPVTVDFESAYSLDPDEAGANVARLKATGAVGCNFEDQMIGGEDVHPLDEQCRRIESIREAVGSDFFINARTDLLIKRQDHDASFLDEVIERGRAFADSGASGFFVPRLSDPRQVERVVRDVPLPLNLIAFPGALSNRDWASAGAARISYGPFAYRALMKTFEERAREAIGSVP
jgi:2-methylisocitrate lyase-like PEP mutase family enzyme